MTFAQILGQERALGSLTAALARGQLHHAYLFGGPEGVGKELTARTLAQAANCERADGEACGECGPCRRIAARNHPDVLLLMPEAEQVARGWAGRADFTGKPSRDIKIAQIRQLQERLSLKALEARRKFAIVLEADALNVQAQNALLKTLEEPPDDTTIVLVTSAPNALLPTIRSRCLRLVFGPLPLEKVSERVAREKGADAATARLCAALSGGSLGAALALDPKALTRRTEMLTRVEELASGEVRGALRLAEDLASDRAAAEAHLELLEAWYRDLAALASGGAPDTLINRDLGELAAAGAARLGAPEALRRIELLRAVRARLRHNSSLRLQFEQLLLRFSFPDA